MLEKAHMANLAYFDLGVWKNEAHNFPFSLILYLLSEVFITFAIDMFLVFLKCELEIKDNHPNESTRMKQVTK